MNIKLLFRDEVADFMRLVKLPEYFFEGIVYDNDQDITLILQKYDDIDDLPLDMFA